MTIPHTLQIGALILLSGLSLGAMFFVFEFHYIWFIQPAQAWALRAGFATGLLALIALWIFFPSYWAVAVVGILVFVFPVFMSDMPASFSLRLLIAMTIAIVLLIGATALRRYVFPW